MLGREAEIETGSAVRVQEKDVVTLAATGHGSPNPSQASASAQKDLRRTGAWGMERGGAHNRELGSRPCSSDCHDATDSSAVESLRLLGNLNEETKIKDKLL